jgi:queuine/archaeosine tRNA-ribosyltransferase
MNESEVLKIEDILPNLMGSIKIEVFENQITKCIDSYENSIEQLKAKILDYIDTAKICINKVRKKYMEIRYQQCQCEICNNIIKEDNIYIFPCGHLFDPECIFNQIRYYSISISELQPKVEY